MEAVAAHALRVQLRGQREHLRDLRIAAVERSVEAGDLRQLGSALQQQPDRSQVVRLVQGRKRHELLQRCKHVGIQPDRPRVFEPSMHDTMADADQAIAGKPLAQKCHQMLERAGVTKLGSLTPRFLGGRLASAIQRNEVRRGVKAFDLAALIELQLVPSHQEERELDARRACIQDDDRVSHKGRGLVMRDS